MFFFLFSKSLKVDVIETTSLDAVHLFSGSDEVPHKPLTQHWTGKAKANGAQGREMHKTLLK